MGGNDWGRGTQGRNGYGYNDRSRPSLPQNYLTGGYFKDPAKTKLKKEYIIDYPKEIADALDERGDLNRRTQIRRFYDFARRVYDEMQYQQKSFEEVEADLAELVPHASYARERKLVSSVFVDFIEQNLRAVRDEHDFRAFMKHFEAIIAYTKKN